MRGGLEPACDHRTPSLRAPFDTGARQAKGLPRASVQTSLCRCARNCQFVVRLQRRPAGEYTDRQTAA